MSEQEKELSVDVKSILNLTVWFEEKFQHLNESFHNHYTHLENKIENLEQQIQSLHAKISVKSNTTNKSKQKRSVHLNTTNNEIIHKNNLYIMIAQEGIKWIIQGDTYNFRQFFHNSGCLWNHDVNGWIIYNKNTLDYIIKVIKNKCPSINILWN